MAVTVGTEAAGEASVPFSEPILLYDGVCGLCNRSVRFILRHDRRGAMRFAPLQGRLGQDTIRAHPELAGVDSVVLLTGDDVLARSAAVLGVLSYLGRGWRMLGVLARLVPRPLRDRLYDLVARRRYAIFGRHDACPLPAPGVRARFIDLE